MGYEPTTQKLLDLLTVTKRPGVYILGCLGRNITIYSQQVRAINLVDALCKSGWLVPGARVAIVGGGAAGITAAAALVRRGALVKVLESLPAIMALQRTCTKRWIHPHIYHWPDPDDGPIRDKAGLPVLDWEADFANVVVEQMENGLSDLQLRFGEALKIYTGARVTGIFPLSYGEPFRSRVAWELGGDTTVAEFDLVILAVGFGMEKHTTDKGFFGYWEDTALESLTKKEQEQWLVSGTGDGGLIDLMRLCIQDFTHHRVLMPFLKEDHLRAIGKKVRDAERALGTTDRDKITALFRSFDFPEIQGLLKAAPLRSDLDVVFNGTSAPYGADSSRLNRLIVSQLERLGAFKFLPGKIEPPVEIARSYSFIFQDEGERNFGQFVPRHGADSALAKSFPEILTACQPLKAEWDGMLPGDDFTCRPMWSDGDFTEANETCAFAEKVGCLVVATGSEQEGDEPWIVGYVKGGLETARSRLRAILAPRELDSRPKVLRGGAAFRCRAEYDRTVRSLCSAEIVVFDVTGYQPETMLLLGLRAAARRGVTVLTSGDGLGGGGPFEAPFNLREINPIRYSGGARRPAAKDPGKIYRQIGAAIADGLRLLQDIPGRYLDLPAYESVRRGGGAGSSYTSASRDDSPLILCPFDHGYTKRNWPYLRGEIHTGFGSYPKRIVDIPSPRLVSQRLFEMIRQRDACFVDWTQWNSNVFFELGVRLAVHDRGPICLLEEDDEGPDLPLNSARGALIDLFRPIRYSPDEPGLWETIKADTRKSPAEEWSLRGDYTHRLISGSVRMRGEPTFSPVHRELIGSAESLVGKDPRSISRLPILFEGSNQYLTMQAQTGAVERLLAAWYYLQNRHHPKMLPKESEVVVEYLAVGRKLIALLDQYGEQQDKEILKLKVQAGINEVENGTSGGGSL
jgi:hypothetical protein